MEGGGKGDRREENELTDLGHVQQYFQIHQQFIDIPVEDDQLSLAQGEPPVRVRRGNHTALAGPKETVAGQLHIQRQTGEQKETIREQTTSNQLSGSRLQAISWESPFASLWCDQPELNNGQSP